MRAPTREGAGICPLIRLACGQPPSPQGEGLGKTKKGQVWNLSLKTQRRNAVSQNVLLPTFLSRKVGGETQFRIKFLWFLSFLKKGTALFLLNVHHQAHPAGVAAALKLGV